MINHPNRNGLKREAETALNRTGLTPLALEAAWKRDLGLYDEVIAQRRKLMTILEEICHALAQGKADSALLARARTILAEIEGL